MRFSFLLAGVLVVVPGVRADEPPVNKELVALIFAISAEPDDAARAALRHAGKALQDGKRLDAEVGLLLSNIGRSDGHLEQAKGLAKAKRTREALLLTAYVEDNARRRIRDSKNIYAAMGYQKTFESCVEIRELSGDLQGALISYTSWISALSAEQSYLGYEKRDSEGAKAIEAVMNTVKARKAELQKKADR